MAHTKAVRFVGQHDYAAVVDGNDVGFSSTLLGAEKICNDYVTDLVKLEARYVADACADPDTTALLDMENAGGVDYFDHVDRATDGQPTCPYILVNTPRDAAQAVARLQRRRQSTTRRAA